MLFVGQCDHLLIVDTLGLAQSDQVKRLPWYHIGIMFGHLIEKTKIEINFNGSNIKRLFSIESCLNLFQIKAVSNEFLKVLSKESLKKKSRTSLVGKSRENLKRIGSVKNIHATSSRQGAHFSFHHILRRQFSKS